MPTLYYKTVILIILTLTLAYFIQIQQKANVIGVEEYRG